MSVVQGTMGVIRSGGTGCQPGIERREVAGVNPPARKRFETQIKRFLGSTFLLPAYSHSLTHRNTQTLFVTLLTTAVTVDGRWWPVERHKKITQKKLEMFVFNYLFTNLNS